VIERILQLIEERGITAYKLTTDLGFSSSSISEWKKGRSSPKADAIIKIAGYFDVTTDYLLTGTKQAAKRETELIIDPEFEDFLVAASGGDGEITQEAYDEVAAYVKLMKARLSNK